jgi:hypothetical protein
VDPDNLLADFHGDRSSRTPEVNLIPTGWHIVKSGPCRAGDKYWSTDKLAWLPITVNSDYMAEKFLAVIRRGEPAHG